MLEKLLPEQRKCYSVPSTPYKILKHKTNPNTNDSMIIEEEIKKEHIEIDEILDFFKRESMAKDKFKPFLSLEELTEIINLNDINEEYIYSYLKAKANELFEDMLKYKVFKLGLNQKHFQELYKNENYDNQKIKFLQDIKDICDTENELDIYDICQKKSNEISEYFSYGDLNVNQPIDFKNENYMYLTLRDIVLHYFLNLKPSKLEQEKEKFKLFIPLFNNLDNYDEKTKMQIIFASMGWTDVEEIKKYFLNKLYKEKTINDLNDNGFNVNISNDNFLIGTFNNNSKIIKIKIPKITTFHLNCIEAMIKDKKEDYILENENMIFDDIELLKCVKLEFLDKYNYYTPHINILKEIIFSILNSGAIKDYYNKYCDYECTHYPFENIDFFNKLWENKFHFLPFQKNTEEEASTLRIYSTIFFQGLPSFSGNYLKNPKIYRLFNYAYIIVIFLHEMVGHLEKIIIYFVNKNIRVNTCENLEFDENINYAVDECEEDNFIEINYKKYENKFKTTKINKSSKKFQKKDRASDINKVEGGNNLEKVFYGGLINDELMTVNECLFILNVNNYKSLKSINKFAFLDKCFNFSIHKKRYYSDSSNFSNEINQLLKELNISIDELKKVDINILKVFSGETDSKNWRYKNKSNVKRKSCVPMTSGKRFFSYK